MKIVSFNVNSLRMRLPLLKALVASHQPDVIGVQETKVQDQDFPTEEIERLGYSVHFHGQKTHYGVALLSRQPPQRIDKGFPHDGEDAQRRLITGHFALPGGGELAVVNGYFPQGENRDHPVKFPAKEAFYRDLTQHLGQHHRSDRPVVVLGDFNIAPRDQDVGIDADGVKRWLRTGKTSFLPEERVWMERLMAWGLVDTYRELHPEVDDRFSWFDYRSRGFEREPKRGLRIDLVLVSAALRERVTEAGIDYELRAMTKPSDHCPIWAGLDLAGL